MGGSTEALEAPVLRPTKAQFSRPFCDYVREVRLRWRSRMPCSNSPAAP